MFLSHYVIYIFHQTSGMKFKKRPVSNMKAYFIFTVKGKFQSVCRQPEQRSQVKSVSKGKELYSCSQTEIVEAWLKVHF